jgi:hypothetical protein
MGRSRLGWLRIVTFALLCGAHAAYGAEDAITIGARSAAPRGVAYVPVYLRDVSGTPLGIDQGAGNRIEALVLKITHSPASAVASMSFQRGGIASITPKYERQVQGIGTFGYVAGYSESTHLALSLDAAAPGDFIGNLVVTLSPQAVIGSTVVLSVDAATATLSNDRGTIGETVANGALALTNGSVAVKAATTTTLASSPNPSATGQEVTFTATVTSQTAGSLTGSVTFREGPTVLGSQALSGNQAVLTLSSLSTGGHSVTAEYGGDGTFASSTSFALTQTVTMTPFGAPPGLSATASGSSLVAVTWWPVASAAYYEVRRSVDNGPYLLVGSPTNHVLQDVSVEEGHTYLYIVRAVQGPGTVSSDSNVDAATTIAFTNDPLVPSETTVKAAHPLELRSAVNAFRKSAGLAPASFSDASLTPATPIRAAHILELRDALNPARSVLGLPAITFSDAGLTTGSPIKAAHVEELRTGVK